MTSIPGGLADTKASPRQRGPDGPSRKPSRPRSRAGRAGRKTERGERAGQVLRERGRERKRPLRDRMPELELGRMESLTTEVRDQLLRESTDVGREAQGLFDAIAWQFVHGDTKNDLLGES